MANKGFTGTQKQYLEGLASGLRIARGSTRSVLADIRSRIAPSSPGGTLELDPGSNPDQVMLDAQDRQLQAGHRLSPEEKAKRRQPPHDLWARMAELARERRFPEGDEVFLYKFQGLFYVSPVEEAFMCRLRFAGGQVHAYQLRGVADLADRHGHPVVQLTTRSNLQLRGIRAEAALDVLEGLLDLGIVSRGTGGDAVRNLGATPTSGFDARELIETLPLAQKAHHRILSDRALQALPRKFTVAFEGGGAVSALAETCDVGFRAVRVPPGEALPAGVYYRLSLGGATSHGRYGRDAGVLVRPERALDVLEQIVLLYVEHGDRTNRRRARLAYLLESWGMPRFIAELQDRLRPLDGLRPATGDASASEAEGLPGASLLEFPLARCQLPAAADPFGHIGFHPQKVQGQSYVGVVLDSAQLSSDQARGLAHIAEQYGSGEVRLTPHQNLIIPGLSDASRQRVEEALSALGLAWKASAFRSRLVACTGSPGCQFAFGDTKRRGEQLVRHLEAQNELDRPLSIHISGCHHACAQHMTADIGLLALRDPAADADGSAQGHRGDGADTESYQLWLGGELSDTARFGHKYGSALAAEDVSRVVQEVVDAYLTRRLPDETFREFVGRIPPREPERRVREERVDAGGLR
jgi:ferredoxin-nitrite reductase